MSGHGSSTQLIGTGTWKAAGAITFVASYNNGPPDTTSVSIGGSNAPSMTPFSLTGPNFTGGATQAAISNPTVIGAQVRFTLSADKGATNDTDNTDQTVTFLNFRAWGSLASNTSLDSTDIDTLYADNNELVNSSDKDAYTFTVASGKYFAFAYRDNLTDPTMVYCGTGANQLTVAMDPSDATAATPATTQVIDYQNTNGFEENYRIIVSKNTNITDHSTTLDIRNNTSQKKNYFFWGTSTTSSPNETLVEGLENSDSTYDQNTITGQTLSSITVTNTYVYIAIPTRHGINNTDYQFKESGFPFGVNSPTTIAITNPVGFTENYYVYRSENVLTYANPVSISIASL